MPTPKPNENEDDFISRCISYLKDNEPDVKPGQRYAMCKGIWDQNEASLAKEKDTKDK